VATRDIDPVGTFGFSWRQAVSGEKPGRWIILDFLGFSRPNLDFSMGYTDSSEELFSSRSFPSLRIAERKLVVEAVRKRWVAHQTSSSEIPIFRNVLSPGPSPVLGRKGKGRSL
jgi:hypothetical protein